MSRRERIEIHAVQFADEGIQISYMRLPTDIRVGGAAWATHSLQLHASHPDYSDDIAQLRAAVRKVLENALEDFNDSAPHEPTEPEDDDDERGMGE